MRYSKNVYLTKRRHSDAKRQESRSDFLNSLGKIMTILVGTAVVVSLFWITRNFVLVSPYFNIKNITVTGNKAVPKEDIIKLTGIEPGRNIFKLNLVKVQYQIKENPLFDKVCVKRCLPDKVEIQVEERKSAAFLNIKGDFYLVSENGIIFKKLSSVIYENLPIITNVNLKSIVLGSEIDSYDLKMGLKVIKDIKSVQPELLACISEINAGNADEIIVYTNNGIKIKVDKNTDKSKWLRLNMVISAANSEKIPVGYVDMRYNKQIVLKPAEKTSKRT
ncbi:MAG: FtsQ-type POTRA domain-containing protein [bacterium]|nr:FtsQ-type POTRA domain-containing protein [bacterium]